MVFLGHNELMWHICTDHNLVITAPADAPVTKQHECISKQYAHYRARHIFIKKFPVINDIMYFLEQMTSFQINDVS